MLMTRLGIWRIDESALDARLDRIETFLKEKLPRADVAGDQA